MKLKKVFLKFLICKSIFYFFFPKAYLHISNFTDFSVKEPLRASTKP